MLKTLSLVNFQQDKSSQNFLLQYKKPCYLVLLLTGLIANWFYHLFDVNLPSRLYLIKMCRLLQHILFHVRFKQPIVYVCIYLFMYSQFLQAGAAVYNPTTRHLPSQQMSSNPPMYPQGIKNEVAQPAAAAQYLRSRSESASALAMRQQQMQQQMERQSSLVR